MSDNCRSCGKTIWWATTKTGKAMPLDGPDPGGNVWVLPPPDLQVVDADTPGAVRARSHFATCPHADTHRRKKDHA